jgi:membrane-associated phospholipid phosphatase
MITRDLRGPFMITMAGGRPAPAGDTSTFDDGAYQAAIALARHTAWLNGFISWWSDYGIGLFVALAAVWAWRARHRGPAGLAPVLWVPGAMALAVVLSGLLKLGVGEERPCRVLPVHHIVAVCPATGDYSFPSNHAVLAAAAAVALWGLDRRLGIIAVVNAIVIAVSRVYIGVHYPHDIAVGLLLGAVVAWTGWRIGPAALRRAPVAH